jgi:hypothetical protein
MPDSRQLYAFPQRLGLPEAAVVGDSSFPLSLPEQETCDACNHIECWTRPVSLFAIGCVAGGNETDFCIATMLQGSCIQ